MENSILYDDVYIGLEVIDEDGKTGIITKIYDSHNVMVEYDKQNDILSGTGLFCLEKDCEDFDILFKNKGKNI